MCARGRKMRYKTFINTTGAGIYIRRDCIKTPAALRSILTLVQEYDMRAITTAHSERRFYKLDFPLGHGTHSVTHRWQSKYLCAQGEPGTSALRINSWAMHLFGCMQVLLHARALEIIYISNEWRTSDFFSSFYIWARGHKDKRPGFAGIFWHRAK